MSVALPVVGNVGGGVFEGGGVEGSGVDGGGEGGGLVTVGTGGCNKLVIAGF